MKLAKSPAMPLPRITEVVARGGSEDLPEHRRERARGLVAESVRRLRDRASCRQGRQRGEDPGLLPPQEYQIPSRTLRLKFQSSTSQIL